MLRYPRSVFFTLLTLLMVSSSIFISCTKEAESKPQFIFKPAPNKDAAAKIGGKVLTVSEVNESVESELYEAEMKVYEIKMNRIRSLALKTFMEADPAYKGDNDAFLNDVIAKKAKVADKDIDAFAKERGITKDRLNAQMKERIRAFLLNEKKQEAIDNWMAEKTKNSPVEVYLQKPERPVKDVPAGDSPFMGGANAKVTIVEFSDFQCPYCKRGGALMGEIKKKYGNKVKVVFKHFPLPFHQHAKMAAQAANCAHKQKKEKFWDLHDKMFDDQQGLAKEGLLAKAAAVGLNKADFEKCLGDSMVAQAVQADIDLGQKVGVKSTPTFFVNGKMINGAQPIEVFSEVIDEELKK